MQLSKKVRNAVCFAQFCINHNFEPRLVAELQTLIDNHVRAWVRQNNNGPEDNARNNSRLETLEKKIDLKAKEIGFADVEWPGLMPEFTLPNGTQIQLPGL